MLYTGHHTNYDKPSTEQDLFGKRAAGATDPEGPRCMSIGFGNLVNCKFVKEFAPLKYDIN